MDDHADSTTATAEETPRGELGTGEARGEKAKRETHHVLGEELLSKVKELVREGNVRRILIRNEKGRTLVEIPLSLGVVGAMLLPVWAGVGALAAVVTKCSLDVERFEEDAPADEEGSA